jgi:hypothetical protein
MWHCSQQHQNRDEAKFCGKCGEHRDTRPRCSECGSSLEPEDSFCTSCGQPRATEAKLAAPTPAPVAPVEASIEASVTKASPVSVELKADEPVTFSFGGMSIAMKDDPGKPDKTAKASGTSAGARSGRMSSTTSAILSFLLIAAVLGLAFYLVTR